MAISDKSRAGAGQTILAGWGGQEMTKRTRGTAAYKAALVLGGALLLGSAGPASATAFITSCGYQITAPGTYILTQNLACSSDGIDVRASNVHLVLAKHTLTGV